MSGGKKFNVWVVYADLFSNLSVFLFISAFGMFAALGSGALTPRPGLLPHTTGHPDCSKQVLDTGDAFAGSKFTPISDKQLPPAGCAHYFALANYGYRRGSTDIILNKGSANVTSFTPWGLPHGVVAEATFFGKFCAPVWTAALRARTSRLTIIGAASSASATSCHAPGPIRHMQVRTASIPLPHGRSFAVTGQYIQACRSGGSARYCNVVRACPQYLDIKSNPKSKYPRYCVDVNELDANDQQTPVQCLINVGQVRAQSFAQLCEKAVEWDYFDETLVEASGEDPSSAVNLKSKWMDRVHIGGVPVTSPARKTMLRDGAIIVELQPQGG
jgi:hypothetical protein